MLGMSCAELISLCYSGQPEAPLLLPPPPYLSTLNSRSFLFKIEQGRFDSGSMRMSFSVSGVVQLSDIIYQLASLPTLVTLPEFPPALPPCPSALDLPMLSLKRSYSQIQSTTDVVQLQPTVPICQSNDIELVSPVVVTSCPSSNQTYVLALPAKKPKNE
ncbi:hypothetical protein RIF29_00516 [Crotalaria pallida]|uniref:Uncharacterized protein n=1 Tax=Crotalaria pallida TaxID=3830 RepID=A0AAN9IW71_CROPI